MFLDIFYNNKGGTTIYTSNGKYTDEKERIAKFIIEYPMCLSIGVPSHKRDMLIRNVDPEEFKNVVKLLKEDDDCEGFDEETSDKNTIIKFNGSWGDKFTLTYYNNTKNARLQGRPLFLFSSCVSLFYEKVSLTEYVSFFTTKYPGEITEEAIVNLYKTLLPNSHDKHPEKLKRSLLKAVSNLYADEQRFMCTELTFEALRALEGHIKLTLLKYYSISSPNEHGTLQMFRHNEADGSVSILSSYEEMIGNPSRIQYYKDAYKYYIENRHRLFHWDYPDSIELDTTEQIEDVEDAKSIIRDTLEMIDRFYLDINGEEESDEEV